MSNTFGDGTSQDQADFFTGVESDRKTTEKGTPAKRMPAFILGEEFIGDEAVCLILGDNIFYGVDFSEQLEAVKQRTSLGSKATIFGYTVNDPQRYGVIEYDTFGNAISIEEKPKNPKSNYAVPGLYFYDNEVIKIAENLKPSARGEYEITDINQEYLKSGKLQVKTLPRGTAWLDTGTHGSLLDAGNFVRTLQERQGLLVGSPDEIAFENNWISKDSLKAFSEKFGKNQYGKYFLSKI